LTKIYRKYPFCSSSGDTKAVDNLSLVIEDGEIFCLLGHNGAGKTTIINMLTGLFLPTSGFATIYGYDIETQIENIQNIMGVCPQQNILWDELTAREHLTLFAVLKGISPLQIVQEVNAKLSQAGLLQVANQRVSTFSGGMKRRLSVAISSIGEPRIIFMDEPTTGLDPVHKQEVWHLIEDMKKNRVIMLTTHSMEEADILGSRIGILVEGKLRCLGNSLRLKSRYGEGYKVSFIIKDPKRAKILIKEMLEEWNWAKANLSGSFKRGSFLVRISREHLKFIPDLIQFLEESPDVSEWGLSHSTLEEVFLNITNKYSRSHRHSSQVYSNSSFESLSLSPRPMSSKIDNIDNKNISGGFSPPKEKETIQSVSINMSQSYNDKGREVQRKREKTAPTSYPFRALFRKNFSLQKRQTFTNFCQIVTPVLTMAILVLLQLIIRSQLGNDFETRQLVHTVPFPLNEPGFHFPQHPLYERLNRLSMPSPSTDPMAFIRLLHSFYDKVIALNSLKRHLSSVDTGRSDHSDLIDSQIGIDEELLKTENRTQPTTSDCLIFFLYADTEANVSVGNLLENGTADGLLGEIAQYNCTLYNHTAIYVPYYQRRESLIDIEDEILADIITYNNESLTAVDSPPLAYLLPDGFVAFHELNYSQFRISYTFAVNTNVVVKYHRPNNFTRLDIQLPNFLNNSLLNNSNTIDMQRRLLIINEGRFQLQSMINRAFTSYTMRMHNVSDGPILSSFLNIRFVQRMPYYATADLLAILEAFGTILYPVALSLQLPIYMYLLVLEKSEKLKSMMQQHGMKSWHYVLTNYTFFLILYSLVVGFFWVSGVAVQIRFFIQTHPLWLLLFFFGWGNCMITIAFFMSSFLNSPRVSSIVGYGISLLGTLIAEVVCIGIYGPFAFSLGTELPKWLFIWPQFSFVRGIYLMNDACAEKYSCYGPPWTLSLDSELMLCLCALYAAPIFYFVVFLYFDQVVPSEYGVAKHPLFCFLGTDKNTRPKEFVRVGSLESNKSESDIEQQTLLLGDTTKPTPVQRVTFIRSSASIKQPNNVNANIQEVPSLEDPDVVQERERVKSGDYPPDTPLVICNLRKEYPQKPRPKVALDNLCLIVGEDECFGLLGENGAGKTTTISILTGLIPPTSGWATVAGYDIRTQIDMVQLVIGVCPQFDCQWSELTVLEHILFYARLKGVPPSDEMTHARVILTQVGLWNVKDRLSRELSGGMRRRLSIAISLVGDSKIVFMDEPTTGLDPSSRRQIWDIIINARKGRAIFLTTHSMEEAEILCTRVGILAHGVLCCLGSQQHLKNAFGEGYRLKINFSPPDEEKARNFVLSSFPSATILASFKGAEEYQLDKDTKISHVFTTMEERQAEFGIVDWSITQVGLLDVFHKIVAATHQLVRKFSQEKWAVPTFAIS
jgi:ABC-type multidrug transport system ATPase subunit